MNKEGFRYYNYSDAFYNAIVEYLQTNTLTDNLPFANSCHKTKWIQRLNQYELVGNDLYFTDVTTGKIPSYQKRQYFPIFTKYLVQ